MKEEKRKKKSLEYGRKRNYLYHAAPLTYVDGLSALPVHASSSRILKNICKQTFLSLALA